VLSTYVEFDGFGCLEASALIKVLMGRHVSELARLKCRRHDRGSCRSSDAGSGKVDGCSCRLNLKTRRLKVKGART
jgi:hypothetical protein